MLISIVSLKPMTAILSTKWGGNGLDFYDNELRPVAALYGYKPSLLPDPNYYLNWCGLQDMSGLIWIGGQHGRIMQLNPVTHKTIYLHPKEFEEKPSAPLLKTGQVIFGLAHKTISLLSGHGTPTATNKLFLYQMKNTVLAGSYSCCREIIMICGQLH